MRGWLFNFAAAVSLALCVMTAGLWVRDRLADERVSWVNAGGTINWWADSSGGKFFTCLDRHPNRTFAPDGAGWRFDVEDGSTDFALFFITTTTYFRLGEFAVAGDRTLTHNRQLCIVPCWPLVLAFLILPAYWLMIRLRNKKREHSCPNCGYDLRATPDRCPECGTPVAKEPADQSPRPA
ncbi:MAG TPA: hypothetical protein VK797_05010 [Tepidisphaeraceae bacterium]|jgi:hypothetical protein|nr:hypothetical protein [Tepidisphaeraceae bacterium]